MRLATKAKQTMLALALLVGLMSPQVAAQCEDSYFPIYAGGATGKEDVRCFVYDPVQQLIVVGGVTNSADFAPAPNDHGYLFALDLKGNWMWGSFFYNVSYAVSSIDGCQLSSQGNSLALTGLGNQVPLLMDVNITDGTFNRFISLDYINASPSVVPQYVMSGAIFYDERDYRDYQPYFYTAFVKDNSMFMLRVADGGNLYVDWNYRFVEYSTAEIAANKLLDKKEANFIVADPKQQAQLYMVGRYRGLGSVIRFNKRDGTVRWHAQFDKMSRINSVSQARNDDELFLCGDYQPNETTDVEPYDSKVNYKAIISRLRDDGDVGWIVEATGRHPKYDAGVTYNDQDRCMAISYYKEREQLAVIIQGKMSEVRPAYKGDYYDTILVQMDSGGTVDRVSVITQGSLSYDMYTAKNGALFVGDIIFFSGWSYGFETDRQTLKKDTDADYDAYIYKYKFGEANSCLHLSEADEVLFSTQNIVFTSGADIRRRGL